MSSSDSLEKNCSIHLNAEIEINLLRKALADKQIELNNLKSECYEESDRRGEIEDVVLAWQDKFERLFESYKKIHKINQNLEDKLLKLVDRNSGERAKLTTDCTILNIRLRQANFNISHLQKEVERYKQDISLAIQLLHCKPNNFLSHNTTCLPANMQSKIASYMKLDSEDRNKVFNSKGKYQMLPTYDDNGKEEEIAKFSSMNSNFSLNNASLDGKDPKISPNIIAEFLENEIKTKDQKHCETCSCCKKQIFDMDGMLSHLNVSTQTDLSTLNCIRCNSDLNSPSHTHSPYFVKLKSSDSVISETSASDFTNQNDKATFSPLKNESLDLLVNPVLGHHRLCDLRLFQKEQQHDVISDRLDIKAASDVNRNLKVLNENKIMKCSEKQQQQAIATANVMSHGAGNGSNNSIWSRTSSKECAKIFENFNRNLIKAMKAEHPKKNAPRICALKIQDDSNNVLLDNDHEGSGGEKEIVYRRRSRLLDDAFLEDDKNITGIPINLGSSQSSQNNDSVVMSIESGNQNTNSNLSSSKNEICDDEIHASEKTAKKSNSFKTEMAQKDFGDDLKNRCFDLKTHTENELSENILYRKQKFVAEWLQNSSNIPKSSLQQSSTSANVSNDVDAAIRNNIKELDFENNNSTEAASLFNSSSVQLKVNYSNGSINNAQDSYKKKLKNDHLLITNSGSNEYDCIQNKDVDEEVDDADDDDDNNADEANVDIAQMEYNVRKFLLKQHEWSMTSVFQNEFNDLYSDDEEPIFVRRTETNL